MENILENNKLIAEFMGYEWFEVNKPYIAVREINGCIKHFQTDWNDLMEVVEKIESLKLDKLSFSLIIEKDRVTIYYCHEIEPERKVDLFFEWSQKTKIGNTYKIVVEFIKWYNEQKK